MGIQKFRRRIIAPGIGGISTLSDVIRVNTVAGLEAALAAQKAKQTIEIESGVYQLTKTNSIIAAASYGVLKGIGDVQIDGAAGGAKGCFDVDPAACTSTFKYTFENIRVRGYTALPGITIDNATVTKKMVLVFRNCSIGGTPGIDQSHTLTTEAIRLYFDGWKGDKRYQGEIDITPGSADDKFIFKGVELSADVNIGTADKACYILFRNCIIPHEGLKGGHTNNICSIVGSFTYQSGVANKVDSNDSPDNLNPTLLTYA